MIVVITAVLFGLVMGSFFNVLIYRLPRDQDFLWSFSRCPECGKRIAWYDNIPLVSYLVLGGTCRSCGETISLQYPLVELLTASLLGGVAYYLHPVTTGEWFNFLVMAGFCMPLIPIAVIDFQHSIIPNGLNAWIAGLGAVVSPFPRHPWGSGSLEVSTGVLFDSWMGLFVGGGVMLLMALLAHWYYGEVALGMGDVKLVGACGLWLGPALSLGMIFLGSIIGAVVGSIIGAASGEGLRMKIPFGPFLCVSGIVVFLVGNPVLDWWFGPLY